MKFFSNFILCLILLLTLFSCSVEKQEIKVLTGENLAAISQLGFRPETAKLTSDGMCIVERDIALDLEIIMQQYYDQLNNAPVGAEDRQRVVGKLSALPYSSVSIITYSIGSGFTSAEASQIRTGVSQWTNPTSNSILFSEVSPGTIANITFVVDNNIEYIALTSPFPSGGPPFSLIKVDIQRIRDSDCTETCLISITTHETGHALGFHHTDGNTGGWLLGSPTTDVSSIMDSDGDIWLLPGPGPNDLTMASALYPSNNLTLTLAGASVTYWSHDNDFCFLHINYNQPPGNSRCFDAIVEVLQNGSVIRTLDAEDLGVAISGTMHTSKFFLPAGTYQVRTRGKNYKGDFTQTGNSNTVVFTKAF